MAKLSSAERKALPAGKFAGPDRSYPIEDKAHARNAKARASEMEHKGVLSKSAEAKIDAKANKVLGKSSLGHAVDHLDKMHKAPARPKLEDY